MDMEIYVRSAGFRSFEYYLKYFVLPFVVVSCVAFLGFIIFLAFVPVIVPVIILVCGVIFPLLYPMLRREQIKKNFMENLHYFITYASAISLLDLNLQRYFDELSRKKVFGELAKVSEKILYLAHYWTLGFATTCHKVAKYMPLKIVADFFDRFGLALDYGQSLPSFLQDEQKAVMLDYSVEYEKGLEKIRIAKEVFVSLSFLTGYVLVIALLVPMLVGYPAESVMKIVLMISGSIDIFTLFFVLSFVTQDSIYSKSKIYSPETIRLYIYIVACTVASIGCLFALFMYTQFSFLVKVSFGIAPMFFAGLYAKKIDDEVNRKDRLYPEFIRTFAQTLAIKKMDFLATLEAIRIHEFGTLNGILENLRRRLHIGCDKFSSWDYFNAESRSALITSFNSIFVESTTQGGNPVQIGEVISKNFSKMLALKKLRSQMASGFRGALYGAIASFTGIAYFAVQISGSLEEVFSQPYEGLDGASADFLRSSLQGLLPDSFAIDAGVIYQYIGWIIILHAVVSGIMLKHIDGGSKTAGLLDMVLIIFIGTGMSLVIMQVFGSWSLVG